MLLLTHGTNGDVLPIISVGVALSADGHEVTVLTHAPYRRTVEDAGMEFIPIDTADEYEQELEETARFAEGIFREPGSVLELYDRQRYFDQIRAELRTIEQWHTPGDTAVIARHTSGVSALMAGELLGVPTAWVSTWPAQLHALPLMEYIYRYAAGARLNQVRKEFGLAEVRDWRSWFDSAGMQIALWPEWFDAAGTSAPSGVHRTGFVVHAPAESGDLPPAAAALLDRDPPPVLITGGTGKLMHQRFYQIAAEGCVRAGREAILVCRHSSLVPDPLPAGVHHFDRLPFLQVMPRVSAVVHHGGINTIARALVARTPQIILAWSLDRPDNAARLHHHKLAAWLPVSKWSADRVADLLCSTTELQRDPPAPVDPTAAARHTARLLATLPGTTPARPANGGADALAARLRRLSQEQRADLLRRLRPAVSREQ